MVQNAALPHKHLRTYKIIYIGSIWMAKSNNMFFNFNFDRYYQNALQLHLFILPSTQAENACSPIASPICSITKYFHLFHMTGETYCFDIRCWIMEEVEQLFQDHYHRRYFIIPRLRRWRRTKTQSTFSQAMHCDGSFSYWQRQALF